MQKWIILIVVCIIIILGGIIIFNFDIESEYVPEAEIEDIQLRKTIVNLYFYRKDTSALVKESRLIDSKQLLKNPYEELINMLIEGPESNNCEKVIPEGTTLKEAKLNGNIVEINFSNEFVEKSTDATQKYYSIYSIVSTLTQLKEVSGIKILIEGNEIDGFIEEGLNFHDIFTMQFFEQKESEEQNTTLQEQNVENTVSQ